MKHWSFSIIHKVLLFMLILASCAFTIRSAVVRAATGALIQEINGLLADDRGTVYTLKDLKKDDIVSFYMTNTSGNLDPMLGVYKPATQAAIRYEEILERVARLENDPLQTFSEITGDTFIAWDDDSGTGYDASLEFTVPADGDYHLFAGSMVTNLLLDRYEPTFTSGGYRLLIGINAPEVAGGIGEPNNETIATIDSRKSEQSSHVQARNVKFTAEKQLAFYSLRNFEAGDTLYVRMTSTNDQQLPRLFLSDFGGKPLIFAKVAERADGASLMYNFTQGVSGVSITLDGTSLGSISTPANYLLVGGVNAPEVLQGNTAERGLDVFKSTNDVTIGLVIDQIVNVDQRSENFTIVGSMHMSWMEPELAFSPDKCLCAIKKMDFNGLKALANKKEILFPTISFFNQQGNRWSESQLAFIEPSGHVTYMERFTVTLQAPDFDFRIYPFDQQKFKVRMDLSVPTEVFAFKGIDNQGNPLGEQLGEEEWTVVNYTQDISEVAFSNHLTNSRFTATLEMGRHLNYYIFRILVPLCLIIGVSWVIFFLKDYGKQLEVASGNLIVFVAFNFTISNDLPRLGYLTFLDRMIITSFCCAALVVFISVCQKRLETKGRADLASHIDKLVLTFYPLVYLVLVGVEYFLVVSNTAV